MPRNFIGIDHFDKIIGRVSRQGRFAEVLIVRNEIIGAAVEIGEVAAPAAGNTDFLARFIGVINQQNALAPLTRRSAAHHPRGAGAYYDHIKMHDGLMPNRVPVRKP